jgi:hypothetical protein
MVKRQVCVARALFLYFIIPFSPSSCLQQTVGNVLLSTASTAYPRMQNRAMNAVRHQEQGTEHGQAFLSQLLDLLLFVADVDSECASDGRVSYQDDQALDRDESLDTMDYDDALSKLRNLLLFVYGGGAQDTQPYEDRHVPHQRKRRHTQQNFRIATSERSVSLRWAHTLTSSGAHSPSACQAMTSTLGWSLAENVARELARTYLRVNMHGLTAERENMATDFDGILDSIMSSIIDDRMDGESDSEPGKD